MNIQVPFCGLIIIILLMYFYLCQKRVGFFSEKVFLHVLSISGLSLLIDIISVVMLENMEHFPRELTMFVCRLYLVSILLIAVSGLDYILTDVYGSEQSFNRGHIKYLVITAIECAVLLFVLPIYSYVEGGAVYTYGPAVLATYLFAVATILYSHCVVLIYRKRINPFRLKAYATWMCLWLGSACIQFFRNDWALVGFATALGMLVIFLLMENPQTNQDRDFGCFHAHTLPVYLKQCIDRGQFFCAIFVSLSEFKGKDYSETRVDQALLNLIRHFSKNRKAKVFKTIGREVVAIYPDNESMQTAYEELQKQFDGSDDYPASLMVLLPDSSVAESAPAIMSLFQILRDENRDNIENSVCNLDQSSFDRLKEKENAIDEILAALDEDRVEVFYQPIYNMQTGQYYSAEALVRIRRKDGTLIPPGRFIPVAEETGLILNLGERIFEKTCRFLNEQDLEQLGLYYVEVNLSVIQCEQPNLAERLFSIMEKYNVDPEWLNLEITETASIQAKRNLLRNMQTMMEKRVSFSLDDFGNGHSNLDYVIDMPVDIVKLDMSLVQAYETEGKAKAVVRAAVNMLHDMEIKVLTEGVETPGQLEAMRNLGVDYVQGFYFSRPLPESAFVEFLLKNNSGGKTYDTAYFDDTRKSMTNLH